MAKTSAKKRKARSSKRTVPKAKAGGKKRPSAKRRSVRKSVKASARKTAVRAKSAKPKKRRSSASVKSSKPKIRVKSNKPKTRVKSSKPKTRVSAGRKRKAKSRTSGTVAVSAKAVKSKSHSVAARAKRSKSHSVAASVQHSKPKMHSVTARVKRSKPKIHHVVVSAAASVKRSKPKTHRAGASVKRSKPKIHHVVISAAASVKHSRPKTHRAAASVVRSKEVVPTLAPAKKADLFVKSLGTSTAKLAQKIVDHGAWQLPTLELEHYEPNIGRETGIEDHGQGSIRYAWIGSGQCGGRLVKSFYNLGYRKVLALNTTHNDLDLLDLPAKQKFLMDIGEQGAGKDIERGRQAVQQYQQEILHLGRQTFGSDVDHIMVCFGAGGGTGSGSVMGLIEMAKKYARYNGLKNPDKKVGVIMTLPTVGEASSPMVAENAYRVATELSENAAAGKISPLIIIDNDKICKMYPGMTVKSFWPSINDSVASLFDIFNRLSTLNSQYTSFDSVDYSSVIECGGCSIMGLTKVREFSDKYAISAAVKKNLKKTLLAGGFDLSTAQLAGCIVVAGKKLMADAKGLQDNIDYAFDVLSEITGHATIHRGIYEDTRDSLRVYTIIGGLQAPKARLDELMSRMAVAVC